MKNKKKKSKKNLSKVLLKGPKYHTSRKVLLKDQPRATRHHHLSLIKNRKKLIIVVMKLNDY